MTADLSPVELASHQRPTEAPEATVAEEPARGVSIATHRLLLLTLLLSAISSVLAIVVATQSWRETEAADKKKEQAEKKAKRELQELHEEIIWLKDEFSAGRRLDP